MLLIDNNLSPRLAIVLKETYQGIIHVADIMLDEADDIKIWEYALNNNLNILTKDADFNDIQQLQGFPPKIVWIRSGSVSTKYIASKSIIRCNKS